MSVDASDKIVTALTKALSENTIFTTMGTHVSQTTPELGTEKTNTLYVVRKSPNLEEILFGNTNLYSCDCVVAYFMKSSTRAQIEGYSGEGENLFGERLLSIVMGEIQRSVIDISVNGLNIAAHYIIDTNQVNAIDSGQDMYLAEVMTKTIYEVSK